MATEGGVGVPFSSPVDREGIDGSGVRVLVEDGSGLVEDDWIQHDVVQVVREIAGEGFQVRLRVVIMFLQGDGFNTFAILSEQGLVCARVLQKLRGGQRW